MYVGTAVSELVDSPDKRINFSSDELKTAEAQRYLSLVKIRDSLGSVDDLKKGKDAKKPAATGTERNVAVRQIKPLSSNSHASKGSKVISIEEVESGSNSEDDDLPVYAKPDSDVSDSDEDPTVINRDKPTPPVLVP